jgi:hypothetical protein
MAMIGHGRAGAESTESDSSDAGPTWGQGAFIYRRPEAGDNIYSQLNLLSGLDEAAVVNEVVHHIHEQDGS